MSVAVRYIHTQALAQAAIERKWAIDRAQYARRKQRTREDPEYESQVRAAHSQTQKTGRSKKRKAIEEDPLHLHARKDADRMANTRQAMREKQLADCVQERADLLDKVHKRYCSHDLFLLMLFSIVELDAQLADLQFKEQQ